MTITNSSLTAATPVSAARVRYVKLGPSGCWDEECIRNGILRIDFDTGRPDTHGLCMRGDWAALAAAWIDSDKDKGVATRFTNETRAYYEDDGEILWVTFARDRLYWAFLESGVPEPAEPNNPNDTSSFRRVRGGWSDYDIEGRTQLTKSRLPGSITNAASFRGTSFDLKPDDRDRLLRRINGTTDPAVECVSQAQEVLRASLGALVERLTWRDFETLVDMLFLAAGWRRLGRVGGTEKTKDLDLQMPVTGEKAWVQIKGRARGADFASYVADSERMEQYERMFFVYHSGPVIRSDRDNVQVLDRAKIVDMVIGAGFVDWVMDRVA